MQCPKCKIEMYRDDDLVNFIVVHACIICGRRVYDGYPTRMGEKAQRKWEYNEMRSMKHYAMSIEKKGKAKAA